MSVINELIRTEENGNISFGNYSLDVKSKAEDFEHDGDLYKVKTFKEITKLERNGMFVYESVPGTAVTDFSVKDTEVSFKVEGTEDAQITIQLEDDMEYEVFEDGAAIGRHEDQHERKAEPFRGAFRGKGRGSESDPEISRKERIL